MSIYYDLYPINDNINDTPKQGLIARSVSAGTIDIDKLSACISAKSTFTKGEVKGIVEALVEEIELYLSNGYNVNIGDLGTFSVSATSRIIQDKSEIRSDSIQMKRIVHRASRQMTQRMKDVEFVRR